MGAWLLAAGAAAEPSSRVPDRTAAEVREFCTTACRPRAASLSNTTGFATALAAIAIVARRRGEQA